MVPVTIDTDSLPPAPRQYGTRQAPPGRPLSPSTAAGLALGMALDQVLPDPRRGHPVAGFGRAAGAVERWVYAPTRTRGVVFTTAAVAPVVLGGVLAERALLRRGRVGTRRAWAHVAVVAAATWTVVGGAMLGREANRVAEALERGDIAAARARLPNLCGRDPRGLDAAALSRATVESVAENTSDAVVAPLFWGALFGLPGLLGYRAVNTLDAMVGHRGPRYERFGWASARLDDLANWLPARITAGIAATAAPAVGGSPVRAWRVRARYGSRHPSPNAGQCEAAFAGTLDLRLGGRNVYGERVEHRPEMGEGRAPSAADIRRAVRLARWVSAAALAAAVACRARPLARWSTRAPTA